VILLFFALRGRKRGLVLTLCSLVAVITAFVGATFVADTLTPKAADIMVPKITSIIERRLEDIGVTGAGSLLDDDITDTDGNKTIENSDNINEDSMEPERAPSNDDTSETGLDLVTQAMSVLRLPSGLLGSIEDALGGLESIRDIPSALSGAIARAAAETVLYLIIFLIAFILILLLWSIVGHALDLVARLPVLHFLNKTGGFVLGLCKGALFLFVLAWVLRYLGDVIPDDTVEHTYLLHFFMTTNPFTFIIGSQ